jgi:flotillin
MLGRGSANGHGSGGLGLGDGLAAQLLSVSASKPMIDNILSEAGFPAGPEALTSLTSALAQRKADVAAEAPATADDIPTAQLVGTIMGKLAAAQTTVIS